MQVPVPYELSPGAFEGEVIDVGLTRFENTRYGSGTRPVAVTTFAVATGDGEPHHIKYYPTLNWSPGSKWNKLLRALGAEPVPGTQYELDDLIGRRAVVVLDDVTDGEETRMRITDVFSLQEYADDEQE